MISALTVWFLILFMASVTLYLIVAMFQSMKKEGGTGSLWKRYGLSLVFCLLFLSSWAAHGIAEWNEYKADQAAHGQPVEVSEYVVKFSESTLENWQSEFLQLFSFVVMSAVLIHQGSAESRDSDDRMEKSLDRIEKRLKELEA